MKRYVLIPVCLLLLTALGDDSMVCGTKMVRVGDTKATVLKKCGEPASRRELTQTQAFWVYDFGRNKFQHRLFFDGDKLSSITVLQSYGR